jgi:hypothetical protein
MENRYTFDGFMFAETETQLEITILKESGFGYTSRFTIELNTEERLALIDFLKTVGGKDED